MGLLARLFGYEQRSISHTLTSKGVLSIFGISQTDVNVNVETAMRHSTVYACVNIKAQGISSVPFTLYKKTENGREKATKHPLYKLFTRKVNPIMDTTTWRELVVQDLELRGTHYSKIVRDGGGRIIALYPLISNKMSIEVTTNNDLSVSLKYTYIDDNGKVKYFDDNQILKIVGLPASNGIIGVTPITQNAMSIGLGIQTETFGSKFFANGANGSGILSTEGEFKTEEALERLRTQFGEKYTGLANSKKPIILEGGMKWQPITISNNDSQFLETRRYQKSEIAAIFRVSPHLINDLEKATFSNIEHLGIEHVKYCLMPTGVRIETAINTQLLSETEQDKYYMEFNFDALMRGDFKSRMEGYDIAVKGAIMTPNEVRQKENLTTDNTGDKLIMQTSYATLETIEKGIDNASTDNSGLQATGDSSKSSNSSN